MFKNLKHQIQVEATGHNAAAQQHSAAVHTSPKSKTAGTTVPVGHKSNTTAFLCHNEETQSARGSHPLPVQRLLDKNGAVTLVAPATNSTIIGNADTSSRSPQNHSDTAEVAKLKNQNESLQQTYHSYRDKTAELLTKKDNHISRLQERVKNLEDKLKDEVGGGGDRSALKAEQEELSAKLQLQEAEMVIERKEFRDKYEKTIREYEEKLRAQSCGIQRELMQEKTMTEAKVAMQVEELQQNLDKAIYECKELHKDKRALDADLELAEAKMISLAKENEQLKAEVQQQVKRAQYVMAVPPAVNSVSHS